MSPQCKQIGCQEIPKLNRHRWHFFTRTLHMTPGLWSTKKKVYVNTTESEIKFELHLSIYHILFFWDLLLQFLITQQTLWVEIEIKNQTTKQTKIVVFLKVLDIKCPNFLGNLRCTFIHRSFHQGHALLSWSDARGTLNLRDSQILYTCWFSLISFYTI